MENNFCSKPCSECPFRKDSLPGYLGGFSAEETRATAISESPFDCHLTREKGQERKHCAGRMLFASSVGKRFRDSEMENIRLTVKDLNPDLKEQILSANEFKNHHNAYTTRD